MKTYARLILFSVSLLIGVQIPAFMQQYELVSKARYAEASLNLEGFKQTADSYFGGNLQRLVEHYQNSSDAVMQADSQSVSALVTRVTELKKEQSVFKQSQPMIAWHILTSAHADVLQQTRQEYTYLVPLNSQAIAWGIFIAVSLCLLFEGLWGMVCIFCRSLRVQRKPT